MVDVSKFNIVTSFYPIYIATSNIVDGVEGVTLENMTDVKVGCLHDYQLTTKDMNKLEKADAFIINGGGMESFLNKATSVYTDLNIINSSEGVLEQHEEEHHHSHEHSHEENAHIWVSIDLYIKQIEKITDELSKLDKVNADKYMANSKNYIERLEILKEDMHNRLAKLEKKNIVTFHEAFEFFAEEFDLNIVAVIEREPGTYPSAGELAEIIDIVRQMEAKAIFTEPQYFENAANIIARETGRTLYSLDPIVTGDLNKDAYEKTMRKNLEILVEALK